MESHPMCRETPAKSTVCARPGERETESKKTLHAGEPAPASQEACAQSRCENEV